MSDSIENLQALREKVKFGGGMKKQEAIRSSGRGTARDRIRNMLDEGSFVELDTFIKHRNTNHGMFLHQTEGTELLLDMVQSTEEEYTHSFRILASMAAQWVKCMHSKSLN